MTDIYKLLLLINFPKFGTNRATTPYCPLLGLTPSNGHDHLYPSLFSSRQEETFFSSNFRLNDSKNVLQNSIKNNVSTHAKNNFLSNVELNGLKTRETGTKEIGIGANGTFLCHTVVASIQVVWNKKDNIGLATTWGYGPGCTVFPSKLVAPGFSAGISLSYTYTNASSIKELMGPGAQFGAGGYASNLGVQIGVVTGEGYIGQSFGVGMGVGYAAYAVPTYTFPINMNIQPFNYIPGLSPIPLTQDKLSPNRRDINKVIEKDRARCRSEEGRREIMDRGQYGGGQIDTHIEREPGTAWA